MTPRVIIPEVSNVNKDNESDFMKIFQDSEEECEYV